MFPWKVSPTPAVQDVSVILACITNGEAVPKNASCPTKTDCATRQITVDKLVLPRKAYVSILVTLLGMVMLVKFASLNAPSIILVTPVPMVALAKFAH